MNNTQYVPNPTGWIDPLGLENLDGSKPNGCGGSGENSNASNTTPKVEPTPPKSPEAGGGASLDNLSPAEQLRIQNAANRTKQEITVVGSRASGTATPVSDWDYVMSGNRKQRHSAKPTRHIRW